MKRRRKEATRRKMIKRGSGICVAIGAYLMFYAASASDTGASMGEILPAAIAALLLLALSVPVWISFDGNSSSRFADKTKCQSN